MAEHGNMIRDNRDEWESTVSVGTFDIEIGGIQDYPQATAHIIFVCPNSKRCSILLGEIAVDNSGNENLSIWAWDGNIDRPTITPSINCITEKDGKPTGGCGWHGFISNGIIK